MIARTAAGNRIDDKMAAGIARSLIRSLGGNGGSGYTLPRQAPKSRSERVSYLKDFLRAEGARCVGIVTRKHATEALCGTFTPVADDVPDDVPLEDADITSLLITHTFIDLSPKRLRKGSASIVTGEQAIGDIEGHVVARLAQRAGIIDPKALSGSLARVGGWLVLALKDQDPSPFYVPVEEGIFCVQMLPSSISPHGVAKPHDFYLPHVSTFIGLEELSKRNRDIHEELVGLGALRGLFPFPTYKIPDEAVPLLNRSRELGRAWVERTGRTMPQLGK